MKNNHPLFAIDLKISGKVINIPVYPHDNHETLVRRFCNQNSIKQQHHHIVKDKIINSLLNILSNGNVQSKLKGKIANFVDKQNIKKEKKGRSPGKGEKQDNLGRKPCENRHIGSECLKISPEKQISKPKAIKKNQYKLKEKEKKKLMDSDLIRAYETIYKKSRQSNMKNMAQKYLQDCGYFSKPQLQEVSSINPKTLDVSLNPVHPPLSPKPVFQPVQQNKYEIYEKSGQKSKRDYLNPYDNRSLIYQNRYNTDDGELSKYDMYEGCRPSKSFERFNPPPTIISKLYEDSRYYEELVRKENSLRKTRKYKYLVD